MLLMWNSESNMHVKVRVEVNLKKAMKKMNWKSEI